LLVSETRILTGKASFFFQEALASLKARFLAGILGGKNVGTPNQGEGLAMAERLRVLIVDDQRLLCEGFRKLNFS